MIKAYFCSLSDKSFPSIVLAESSGKARYAMVRSAQDSGYEYSFADIVCRRSPLHDILRETRPCSRRFPVGVPVLFGEPQELLHGVCRCSKCESNP